METDFPNHFTTGTDLQQIKTLGNQFLNGRCHIKRLRLEVRDRVDERLRIVIFRIAQHLVGAAGLDDPPAVHDDDPFAEKPYQVLYK